MPGAHEPSRPRVQPPSAAGGRVEAGRRRGRARKRKVTLKTFVPKSLKYWQRFI